MATDTAYDLASVAAMADELEPYLLSKELYWPLMGTSPSPSRALPRLTLGGLLLGLARLRAVEGTLRPDERARLEAARRAWQAARSQWAAAADRKMERELRARLDLWQAFLGECREQRAQCAEGYSQQVGYRVMVALLLDAVSSFADVSAHRARLGPLDSALRGLFAAGPFVWAPEYQPSFPKDRFWYLYGRPRK